MGLDFSHADAHWSYGGFNRFREALAVEAGFNINDFKGFGGNKGWEEMQDDIKPLLNHSDCEGGLTVNECKKVAPRLRQLVAAWDDDSFDKAQALLLAEGMEYAVEQNEPLEFG